jgi:hypothetical protein
VTAVTDSPAAAQDGGALAQGGWALSQDAREAVHDGPPQGRSATAARPVSATPAASPATLAQRGRAVVPAARPAASPTPVSGGSPTTSRTAYSHLSPQAGAAERGGGRTAPGQGEPASARVGGAGPELSAEARVEALDGSERKLLLDHIARVYPAVVEAGFALLAEQRAESAERCRKNGRRREHDRRRRRLAELGDDG